MTFEWQNYVIDKRFIGKGSYSKVYHGIHKETKVEIALKKILFSKLHDFVKDKIISEIHILQKLNHPHIIKLYEYKFTGDYLFLITEYCNGNDLQTWMKSEHSITDKIIIMNQISNGLEYIHSQHIMHRDIKLENVLIHNGIVKLCDFGFSIFMKEDMCKTICGTPLFMSPELLFYKPYSYDSDIWSLGILFYILLFHVHPFGTLYNIDDYRRLIQNEIHIPTIQGYESLIDLIKIMLSIQPEERPTIKHIFLTLNKFVNQSISTHELKQLENEIEQELKQELKQELEHELKHELKQELKHESHIHQKKIIELEEHIFHLEIKLKEKEKETEKETEKKESYYFCCCTDDDDKVTGKGRTNPGYEQVKIETDYFTPPDLNVTPDLITPYLNLTPNLKSMPIPYKKKASSYSSTPSSYSSTSSLSEKFFAFFSSPK